MHGEKLSFCCPFAYGFSKCEKVNISIAFNVSKNFPLNIKYWENYFIVVTWTRVVCLIYQPSALKPVA